jgi:hypothetical protein
MPIVTELWTVWITGSLRKVAFVLGLVTHATLHAQPSASSVFPCNLEAGRITFTFPHHPTSLRKFYLTPCWTFFFFPFRTQTTTPGATLPDFRVMLLKAVSLVICFL